MPDDWNRVGYAARRALGAGATYFGVVFAVGFVLGTIRVLLLVPTFGERVAELAETPFMVLASYLAARGVVRRLAVPDHRAQRLAMGITALALLLLAESLVALWVRGVSLAEYVGGRDPIAGSAYTLALLLFALMPLLVRRP